MTTPAYVSNGQGDTACLKPAEAQLSASEQDTHPSDCLGVTSAPGVPGIQLLWLLLAMTGAQGLELKDSTGVAGLPRWSLTV
jgi:hypothetical protein